jgi:hypothetical protein
MPSSTGPDPRGTRPVRQRVDSRLAALRSGAPPAAGTPQDPWARLRDALRWHHLDRWLLGAALVVLLAVAGGLHALHAPPPGLARTHLPAGTPVRLIAVTTQGPPRFEYRPRTNGFLNLLRKLGARRRYPAAKLDIPDVDGDGLVLWLWIGAHDMAPHAEANARDDAGREYANSALARPVTVGSAAWGTGTLGYVRLGSYDHSARHLDFTIPIGPGSQPQAVRLPVILTPAADTPLPATTPMPVVAGDAHADLRLWQARALDRDLLRELLPLSGTDLPAATDRCVMVDVDLVEKAAAGLPGRWLLHVLEGRTEHGERLSVARERDGLAYLSNGRHVSGFNGLTVTARAEKVDAGLALLKFRQLQLPTEVGATAPWHVDAAAEPFPEGRFVLRDAMRTAPDVLHVQVEGHGPDGADVSLSYQAGMDESKAAIALKPDSEPSVTPSAQREAGRVAWHWAFDVQVRPETKFLALAFRLDFRVPLAMTVAKLTARLQPPRTSAERAGLGVFFETRGTEQKCVIVGVQPDSKAAEAGLQTGDELLTLDGQPPAAVPRVLLRHLPGDRLPVAVRRNGQTVSLSVALDPLG